LYLYAFKLLKNGEDISSLVGISDEDGHNLETTTPALGANENSTTAIVYWSEDPYEDTVAAGTEATYILQATPSGFLPADSTAGADNFAIKMTADTAVNLGKYLTNAASGDYIQLCTSAEVQDGTDANFIWSDVSALSHTAATSEDNNGTASSSGDWANGYLVKNITSFTGESWSR